MVFAQLTAGDIADGVMTELLKIDCRVGARVLHGAGILGAVQPVEPVIAVAGGVVRHTPNTRVYLTPYDRQST